MVLEAPEIGSSTAKTSLDFVRDTETSVFADGFVYFWEVA